MSAIVSVCGPPGCGKTTAVSALAAIYPAYVENTLSNPYLGKLLKGAKDSNAFLNQKWFLDQMLFCIENSDYKQNLILDQDPIVIVYVYARKYLVEERLNAEQFQELECLLLRVEERLRAWEDGRVTLFLDCADEILCRRVQMRDGVAQTPPLKWFHDLRSSFQSIQSKFQKFECLDTSELDEIALKKAALVFAEKYISLRS